MKVTSKVISHSQQRYPTVGDWWFENNNTVLQIRVSSMHNVRYENLVMMHEITEALLCLDRGITETEVSDFDKKFELERDRGLHSPETEPGDDPRAPYEYEHFFATSIERLLASEFNIRWGEYEKIVAGL